MGLADYSVVEKSGSPFSTDFRTGKTSIINQIIEGVDPTFTGIYCIEACIKIVAYGFISGPNTYLRNGWNVLDFTAAVSSVAALIPNVPNVSSLRTLRVLRPLRSLKMLPGMKVIINAMIMAIEPLANVHFVVCRVCDFWYFNDPIVYGRSTSTMPHNTLSRRVAEYNGRQLPTYSVVHGASPCKPRGVPMPARCGQRRREQLESKNIQVVYATKLHVARRHFRPTHLFHGRTIWQSSLRQ